MQKPHTHTNQPGKLGSDAPGSVIIVGGGVFGCACAYQLAKRGYSKVTVVERDDFGVHASSNNPGNINPIHGAVPALIPLALEAYVMHRTLHTELMALGCPDYDFRGVRRVLLAFDEADVRHLEDVQRGFAGRSGFAASQLDANTIAELDARLTREARAALLIEGNMSIDSAAFHRSLVAGATKLGVAFLRDEATGLVFDKDKAIGLRLRETKLHADAFVFATGPWVAPLHDWLGWELPVTPLKGEMLRVALTGPPLEYDFTHGLVSLYRRGEGECWIGVTKEDAGFDESPSEAGRRQLIEAASRIMPAVAKAPILAQTAALRPMSGSGLPLIRRVPGWANCYVANGGGIKGMLLASAVGAGLARLIIDGGCELPPRLME
jgi:glycine oxidase